MSGSVTGPTGAAGSTTAPTGPTGTQTGPTGPRSFSDIDAQYGQIKSSYAGFDAIASVSNQIKQISDTIAPVQPPRSPTQPVTIEQKPVPDIRIIQIALFTILIAFIELAVLPQPFADPIVFLTLCVGIASGFYLSTK